MKYIYEVKQNCILHISKKKTALWLLLVFLSLPHMKAAYLNKIPVADFAINVWRLASFTIIAMRLLLVRHKMSAISLLLIIQQVFLFLVTMMNGQKVYACALSAFSVMSVVLLYDGNGYDRQVFLSSQLFCFEVVIYVNLITELLYPNGMYVMSGTLFAGERNWFLGYYNNHTQYYIPALVFAWLYCKSTGKKLRTYALTAGIFASAIIAWSGGVLMTLFGMLIAYVLLKNHTRVFHYYTYWSMHLAFFLFIMVLKLQNLFRWLIDDILGKWDSLLVRMKLWERVRRQIWEAPLFGHGIVDGTVRELRNGFNWAMHAHNLLLEILYQGGVVNLVLWVMIIVLGGGRIYRYRNTIESKIISVGFLGWCIATLVEPFTTPFLMGMFVIAYHSNRDSAKVSSPGRIK